MHVRNDCQTLINYFQSKSIKKNRGSKDKPVIKIHQAVFNPPDAKKYSLYAT